MRTCQLEFEKNGEFCVNSCVLSQGIFHLELDFRSATFRDVFIHRGAENFSENFMSEFNVGKLISGIHAPELVGARTRWFGAEIYQKPGPHRTSTTKILKNSHRTSIDKIRKISHQLATSGTCIPG